MLSKLFLIFCLYLPFQIALNPAEGVDLASGRILILILALIWLITGFKNRRIFIPARMQTALILSFLFFSGLSLFWVANPDWGVRKLLFLLSIFPVYFVTAGIKPTVIPSEVEESNKSNPSTLLRYTQDDSFKIDKIVKFLIWGAGLAAVTGIIQFLLQFIIGLDVTTALWRNYVTPLFLGQAFSQVVTEYPSWLVNIGGNNYLRAFSIFPDPHMFSFYLGLTLPLAVGLYFIGRKKIYLFMSFAILMADFLTFSRGGYFGLAAGLFFFVIYFASYKRLLTKKFFVFFAAISTMLVSLSFTPVGKRFTASFSSEEGSNKDRFENWQQAADIIKNNPLGVGIGNYSYAIEPGADYRKPIYAHNLYLDIAAETGIINSIIFIALLIFSVREFVKKSRNDILYLGGATGLVIFSIHSVFDTALYSVQALPLLLILFALSTKPDYAQINIHS